jgi:hypothetical protein
MAAQYFRSRLGEPHPQRFTLVFRNGELMRHQDPLAVAQFLSDARLAEVRSEPPHRVSEPPHRAGVAQIE